MRSDGNYSIALQSNRLRTEHTLVESTLFPHHFNEINVEPTWNRRCIDVYAQWVVSWSRLSLIADFIYTGH